MYKFKEGYTKWALSILVLVFILGSVLAIRSTPKTNEVNDKTEVNNKADEEHILSNFIFNNYELSTEELIDKLKIPVEPVILKEDTDKYEYLPYIPNNTDWAIKETFGVRFKIGENESVYDFAKRVAIDLRSNAKLGFSYFASPGEMVIYKEYGFQPLLCSDLALAFGEIMQQNGIWTRQIGIRYLNNVWDSHLTIEIYDPDPGKWIIVDPTFAGVFKEKDGNNLGAGEIQKLKSEAKFVPFAPGNGFEDYYIKPLSNLYNFIYHNGEFVEDYLNKRKPAKFAIEEVKVQASVVYYWRKSNYISLLRLPDYANKLSTTPYYKMDLQSVVDKPEFYQYDKISKVEIHPEKNNSQAHLRVISDTGGGIKVNLNFQSDKVYLVDLKVRCLDKNQKLTFSYQDDNTKQWTILEGISWKHIKYLVVPKTANGMIYIYIDKPIQFDIEYLNVYEVQTK